MKITNFKIPLLSLLMFCINCSDSNINLMQQTMKYKTAFNLSISYAKSKHLDYKERLRVETEQRFRFDFNSTDISFNLQDSALIVRSCIQNLRKPLRQDFFAILPELSQKYSKELAGGYLEHDETALEVDEMDSFRLNIRRDFRHDDISENRFIEIVNELHIAAKRWRNKYYMQIFDELDK